jgi:signal transduction histidine kinase
VRERGDWPLSVRWLTALAVTAVVAVNVAGIWGIALARRDVLDQSSRVFQLEVAARARAIESVLSSTRADLAFLTGSPAFFTLESTLASADPREARWGRMAAEGALLLFLRGHAEVMHLTARSAGGASLVEAGRRGGIPVLWRASARDRRPVPAARISTLLAFETAPGARALEATRLEAVIDEVVLLAHARSSEDPSRACELRDDAGGTLARDSGFLGARGRTSPAGWVYVEAPVRAQGWSATAPWKLECERSRGAALALLEPLTRRYRITMGVNLAVMALALLLGSFAIQQARRRERLEARAREETRVREVERQLFHTERLSTVGRLAAGMAHEINNPLEGMSNYLTLAGEALARGDLEAGRRHLDRVGEGLQRAAGVVHQVLQHADPATAPMTPLDINDVIRSAARFVGSRREFDKVQFKLDLASPAPVVTGSQATLGQVFLNLLLNACEAQAGGGEVAIRSYATEDGVQVEIADRGPGVRPEEASRIFEPFYSTKQSAGLGLSICHSIVRHHGGEIRVENRPEGGALFRLAFPSPGR